MFAQTIIAFANHSSLVFAQAVSGEGLLHALWIFLVIAICGGIIWYVGKTLAAKYAPAALPIWNVVFMVLAAAFLINFFLSLIGHAFIKW
jgi:hypothetical protein